jgi:urease accessory protein
MHGRSALPGSRPAIAAAPALQRATGTGRVRVTQGGIAELYQQGSLRLRPTRGPSGPTEIVAINTAGGLTGGDSLDLTVTVEPDARVVVATPACEKIYRSAGGEATVNNTVTLGAGSALDWLPQPMILFGGARIRRRLDVDVAADATFLGVEGCILGRTAMAEVVRSGAIHDAWRLRRAGALVYADAFHASGDLHAASGSGATLGSACAFATVVYAAPDAEARLDAVREALAAASYETGASGWNGLLVARFLAPDGQALIADLTAFLTAFRAAPQPRSWLC